MEVVVVINGGKQCPRPSSGTPTGRTAAFQYRKKWVNPANWFVVL